MKIYKITFVRKSDMYWFKQTASYKGMSHMFEDVDYFNLKFSPQQPYHYQAIACLVGTAMTEFEK